MTPRQCIAALVGRWYVVVAVLMVSALGVVFIPRDAGVYWSRATVVFIPPINPGRPGNVLEGSDPNLIYFAAAVERKVNGGQQRARLSGDAGLYGLGIKDGWSVTLQNSGGQWQTNYNRPMLTVEVVAPDPDAAEARMQAVIETIEALADGMQAELGAPGTTRIATEVTPREPVISYVGGNWKRAAAAILALGCMVAVAAALSVDRFARTRTKRRDTAESSHDATASLSE